MDIKETLSQYLRALEHGKYDEITALFAEDATVTSPLYGEMDAATFYKALFEDTQQSTIAPLHFFTNENAGAAHFRYEWILEDGTPTSFECVDVVKLSENGKIVHLTIIYDTYTIRQQFEKMKE